MADASKTTWDKDFEKEITDLKTMLTATRVDAGNAFKLNSPTVLTGTLGIIRKTDPTGSHGQITLNAVFQFNNDSGMPAHTTYKLGTLDKSQFPMPTQGTNLVPRMAFSSGNSYLLYLDASTGDLSIASFGVAIGGKTDIAVNTTWDY